jgi:hypothetical protein
LSCYDDKIREDKVGRRAQMRNIFQNLVCRPDVKRKVGEKGVDGKIMELTEIGCQSIR